MNLSRHVLPLSQLEWHDGKLLPHTVFTLQYIHHLRDIEPELTPWQLLSKTDPQRPPELITVVLGACVVGLIKCVDLAWLEMHNNELIQDVGEYLVFSQLRPDA